MDANISLWDEIHLAGWTTQNEFAAWVANRKSAGATINIETAVLTAEWVPDADPYAVWAPMRWRQDDKDMKLHYFARGPDSQGWVWQGDLPDDKRAAMQARIDDFDREESEYYADRSAAARVIDTDTCECLCIHGELLEHFVELAPYAGFWEYFVRNKGSENWVHMCYLPEDKRQALDERGKRERLDRRQIIDTIFDAFRQGGLAAAFSAVTRAQQAYGPRLVKEALREPNDLFGAIGGHLIERGYLTIEQVTEMLRGEPKEPTNILGLCLTSAD